MSSTNGIGYTLRLNTGKNIERVELATSSERSILARGLWSNKQVDTKEVSGSWQPSNAQIALVERTWKNRPAHVYDGPLWRYEGLKMASNAIELQVSRSSYKWHFVLTHETYETPNDYPNPASVTALMVTKDQKLALGVRQGSDQGNRLHTLGAGFINLETKSNPSDPTDWRVVPENVFRSTAREIEEETTLQENIDFDVDDFRLLGIVYGDNHDTSCVIYAPLKTEAEAISLRGNEHSIFFTPEATLKNISRIIETERFEKAKDVKATDHAILALSLLQDNLAGGKLLN